VRLDLSRVSEKSSTQAGEHENKMRKKNLKERYRSKPG
jgi:hypothetical protein